MKIINTPKWDKVQNEGFHRESEVMEALHEKHYNINKELFDNTRNIFLLSTCYLVATKTSNLVLFALTFCLFITFTNKISSDIRYSIPDRVLNKLYESELSFRILGKPFNISTIFLWLFNVVLGALLAIWLMGVVKTISNDPIQSNLDNTKRAVSELQIAVDEVQRMEKLLESHDQLTLKQILEFETQKPISK